jgi:ribosomal protein S4
VVFRLGFANSRAAARQLRGPRPRPRRRPQGRRRQLRHLSRREDRSPRSHLLQAACHARRRRRPVVRLRLGSSSSPSSSTDRSSAEPPKEELPSDVNVQIIVEFYSR